MKTAEGLEYPSTQTLKEMGLLNVKERRLEKIISGGMLLRQSPSLPIGPFGHKKTLFLRGCLDIGTGCPEILGDAQSPSGDSPG